MCSQGLCPCLHHLTAGSFLLVTQAVNWVFAVRAGTKVRIQVPSATISFSTEIPGLKIRPVLINHVIFLSWIFIKHLFLLGSELLFPCLSLVMAHQLSVFSIWYPPRAPCISASPPWTALFLGSWHIPTPLPQPPREMDCGFIFGVICFRCIVRFLCEGKLRFVFCC